MQNNDNNTANDNQEVEETQQVEVNTEEVSSCPYGCYDGLIWEGLRCFPCPICSQIS